MQILLIDVTGIQTDSLSIQNQRHYPYNHPLRSVQNYFLNPHTVGVLLYRTTHGISKPDCVKFHLEMLPVFFLLLFLFSNHFT